ncbi:uncharacterized protein JCM6883_005417 [Sporobolomyces salmoneus]|uniref:uncharacterized protein n=1 Tax=Sporobolomyces salmoneus TaxID=183962 RepID=UPI00317AE4C0
MGLFTRKKRDPLPSPSPSTSSPPPPSSPNNRLAIPQDQRSIYSDHSQKSRSPKNRFQNIFRSSQALPASDSHSHSPVGLRNPSTTSLVPPRQSFQDQSSVRSWGSNAKGKGTNRTTHATNEGSWDDAGIPLSNSQPRSSMQQPETFDRYQRFGGQAASTLSLPVFHSEDSDSRRRISTSTARETIYPIESQIQQEDESTSNAGGKWSRWKMGRAGGGGGTGEKKPRTGSMSSMKMFGGGGELVGTNSNNGDDGGFVVKSFRTVSRVHEDPVAFATSPTSSASPPLPPLPSQRSASALSIYEQPEQQQESIRASIDLGSSQTRRPPLNVLGHNPANARSESSSRYNFGDRAPSPSTISVEAFRLASARSKSSVSLVSLNGLDSPELDQDRPKFEPVQRPSSRTSRRQSTYSELSVDNGSTFLPPRPRFANHSNSSNSSIQSRKSSNHSIGSHTPPPVVQPQNDIPPSDSVMSMDSFTTAAESRTAPTSLRSTPAASRVTSPTKSPSNSPLNLRSVSSLTAPDSELPVRPANVKRLSSGDSDLRWIASYADSITSSELTTSPVTYKSPPLPFPAPRSSETSPTSTPKSKPAHHRISHAPSFSVQPPTPATVESDSSPAGSPIAPRAAPPTPRQLPKRSSSLATESTKSALQSMGIGSSPRRQSINNPLSKPSPTSLKTNSKASRAASRGWMSDSSNDEDEQEALESNDSNSDSDDEVPLSQIRSRSQTDLSLPPALIQAEQRAKAELEAAATAKQAVRAAESKLSGGGGETLGLVRRGSNRRSVSTLSLATTSMSSSGIVSPASPTRSILQRPLHPRSVSNPNTPLPSISSAPPPVPALSGSVADRSSSSSGTGSSSSALLTPGDLSPAVSDLGLKSHPGVPHLSKPSVKFDLAAVSSTQTDPARWNKGRRASAIQSSHSSFGSQQFGLHRPTQSLQQPPFGVPRPPASLAPPSRGPRSSLAPSPSSNSLASSKTAVDSPNATNPATGGGGVHDRMKARHKQEAIEALKIGADLNHPSGLIPERGHDDDDDEDEDEPLANLPSRGSMIGGMPGGGGGSMIGGMQPPHHGQGAGSMQMNNMGMGFGGAFSPLALAPFGVDPYLYASLPLDQKMSLHQRSQQMMAMMQQAAIQAQAESVIGGGSAMGGYGSREGSMIGGSSIGVAGGGGGGGSGPRGRLHGASMSMSNLESLSSYGYGGGPSQFNAGARLPPFAPTFAMSAPFMHPGIQAPQHPGSLYQTPSYANSAIGFSGGGPTNRKGLNPGGRAASMMGFDQQR